MKFNERLLSLRKKKKLSQFELAQSLGIHKNVLGKYERNEVKPSIDVANKMADFFEVSLDFLMGKQSVELDQGILNQVLTIQSLPEEDRKHILFTLNALIRDAKSRFAYSV